jgi:hypothetical protein
MKGSSMKDLQQARDGMRLYLNDADFNEELRSLSKNENEFLTQHPSDSITPKILAILSKDGKPGGTLEKAIVMLVNPNFDNPDEKFKIFKSIGAMFAEKKMNLVAVYQVCEAWVSQQEKKEDGSFMRPSEDPNKMEAIIIAGMTVDGRTNMATVPFQRVTKDKVIFTKSTQYIDYNEADKGHQLESNLLAEVFKGYLMGMAVMIAKKGGFGAQTMAS